MFITTANKPLYIPQPLFGSHGAIHLPGYTEEEKVKIAQKHPIHKQLEENGLSENLRISEVHSASYCREYTREAVCVTERNCQYLPENCQRRVKNNDYNVTVSRSNFKHPAARYRYGMAESSEIEG